MGPPKPVRQEDGSGCGIACVASLAGTKYAHAKNVAAALFKWTAKKRSFYTTSSELIQLLAEMNVQAGRGRMVRHWDSVSPLAIVAINPDAENFRWHWVVFFRTGDTAIVLDPQSKHLTRKDFSRMRLRSYIPVWVK